MEQIRADITIKCASSQIAENFFKSLQPETKTGLTDRSTISMERDDDTLKFVINAKDITAFRATLNSYLIWTRVLTELSGFLEGER
jgi:tRNA threonylcarbamoyladenosine modification (KEOPS) complex  Pcc1 subunit